MPSNQKQPGFRDRLKILGVLTWMDFGIGKPREFRKETAAKVHMRSAK